MSYNSNFSNKLVRIAAYIFLFPLIIVGKILRGYDIIFKK